jgi:glycosyltransferase involved in cell wall biosynthesis
VLHVLSNWKWTERSEPAADLALAEQLLGADVFFACGRSPRGSEYGVDQQVKRKGLRQVEVLSLPKHVRLLRFFSDVREVSRLLADIRPDVVHCHLPNAHLLSALARGRAISPLLMRSTYEPEGAEIGVRARHLYRNCTDGLVVMSEPAKALAMGRYGFPDQHVLVAEPGVDLRRFDPGRVLPSRDPGFGIPSGAFVVGLVTRIRAARRLDLVIEAIRRLCESYKDIQLLLVGRGRAEEVQVVLQAPLSRMGLWKHVVHAGYCRDDRLVAAYRAMRVLVYPMPGTDQSCRTVREAMAAGVPVVAPRVGFLPELVRDGENGRFMEPTAPGLVSVLSDLIEHPDQLTRLRDGALRTARERFASERQARKTLAFYEQRLACLPPTRAFSSSTRR